MSKLADQLRELKVFNNWELLMRFGAVGDVAIEYRRPPEGRLGWCQTRRTDVWSPRDHPKLERDTGGLSRGAKKTFSGNRAASFYIARNWAMEEFGHDYVPSPFGGHIPKHVLAKAQNAVKRSVDS